MGIYDREYYRSDGPSFLDSITNVGQVCKWLILVNVGVFVLQLMTKPDVSDRPPRNQVELEEYYERHLQQSTTLGPVTDALELDRSAVWHGQIWRLLTYAFLHDP